MIDCPPNLGLLTFNALFAAREALVPVSMLDSGALQALRAAFQNATVIGTPLALLAPESDGAQAYAELAGELTAALSGLGA